MIAKQLFEDLASKVSETIANSPAKDMEKNAKAMLTGALSRMDMVTREEFDVQQQILLKTHAKVSELESRLAALEALLNKETVSNQETAPTNHAESTQEIAQ